MHFTWKKSIEKWCQLWQDLMAKRWWTIKNLCKTHSDASWHLSKQSLVFFSLKIYYYCSFYARMFTYSSLLFFVIAFFQAHRQHWIHSHVLYNGIHTLNAHTKNLFISWHDNICIEMDGNCLTIQNRPSEA